MQAAIDTRRLSSRSRFDSTLPGLAYWYLLYPIHALIFRGMIRALAKRADESAV